MGYLKLDGSLWATGRNVHDQLGKGRYCSNAIVVGGSSYMNTRYTDIFANRMAGSILNHYNYIFGVANFIMNINVLCGHLPVEYQHV